MGFFDKEQVPPAPNMQPLADAAKEIATTSQGMAQDQLNWARDQFNKNQGQISGFVDKITQDSDVSRGMIQNFQDLQAAQLGNAQGATAIRDAATTQAGVNAAVQSDQRAIQQKQLGVEDTQLGVQQGALQTAQGFRADQTNQQKIADALYGQYSQSYAPAMARYLADTEAYGSPERIAQAKAEAGADVSTQFQGARDAATRQLESFGIRPSDTRFAALDLGTRIQEAQTKALAQEKAQRDLEAQAFALRNQAITQGQQLPGQGTAAENAATQIGSNVVGATNAAVGAGNTAVGAANAANTAGSNVIGAGNAVSNALQVGTGAQNAATAATTGATQAATGALSANTAASNQDAAAGQLINQTYGQGAQAMGTAPQYLTAANQGAATAGNITSDQYKNQLAQFKAEQSNTSGLGALVGSVAGPVLKGVLTGGASVPMDLAASAAGGEFGGTASEPMAGLSKDDYGSGTSSWENYGLAAAGGGAIPASASPSGGRTVDDVNARLNAGEFVIPRDAASWLGEAQLQKLIAKAQADKAKAQARPTMGPAVGGPPAVVSPPPARPPFGAGPPMAPRQAIPMGAR